MDVCTFCDQKQAKIIAMAFDDERTDICYDCVVAIVGIFHGFPDLAPPKMAQALQDLERSAVIQYLEDCTRVLYREEQVAAKR